MDNEVPVNVSEGEKQVLRTWGFWETIIFSFLIIILFVIIQTAVCVIFTVVDVFLIEKHAPTEVAKYAKALESNGLFLSIATCLCAILCIPFMAFLIYIRKGWKFGEYLCIKNLSAKETLKWALILLTFLFCMDMLSFALGKPIVPEFMEKIYETACILPFLLLTLLVVGPLFEEFFFRGFLFVGILNSRLGALGAAVITSALWASIHMQYDIYGIVQIFFAGLLLSYARVKTGSLSPCIVMHSLMNAYATAELVVKLYFL